MQDMLGDLLAGLADFAVAFAGQPTTVNGLDVPNGALWTEAQPNRIQAFLDEFGYHGPAYDVEFQASALKPPILLRNGLEVVRVNQGWRGVVRRMEPKDANDATSNVVALVVISPE